MDFLVEDLESFLQVEQEAQMGNVQQHQPLLPPQQNFLLHLEQQHKCKQLKLKQQLIQLANK